MQLTLRAQHDADLAHGGSFSLLPACSVALSPAEMCVKFFKTIIAARRKMISEVLRSSHLLRLQMEMNSGNVCILFNMSLQTSRLLCAKQERDY